MPAFEVLDPRGRRLIAGHAPLERLYTGCRWAEGPAYFPAGRYLVWSDIPNNRMLRFDEAFETTKIAADWTGAVTVFRAPSNNSNGNTVDRAGRLVTCEHLARRVTRTEHDGTISVLADRYQGKRLNSPNDVVVKSDGSIWFSDPDYGIWADHEGVRAESEIGARNVYRVDGQSGAVTIATDDFERPNGLAFSPDEKKLYIADTGISHRPDGPKHIRVFDVSERGKLKGGKVFATCPDGLFDGFRLDEAGRIWTSSASGVLVYEPDGTPILRIPVPEIVGNLVFGGIKRNRLYICGQTSLYSIYTLVNGARTF
jgi:gluconolactonase